MERWKSLGPFFVLLLVPGISMTFAFYYGCDENPFSSKPDCEKNQTADLTFENRSLNSTYDVILDGANIGSISTIQTIKRTVAIGSHTFYFRFSNTGAIACSEANPNLAQCESHVFSCSNGQ